MARQPISGPVKMAFEGTSLRIAIADIQPLHLVNNAVKTSPKYAQIAASIRDVGIIEPPVVARDRSARGKYLLLDGHLRIEILKEMGETAVICLISTDDEAFTYNKRVSRIAIIQEHKMILKAIEEGVPEERIAKRSMSMSGTSAASGHSSTGSARKRWNCSRTSTSRSTLSPN